MPRSVFLLGVAVALLGLPLAVVDQAVCPADLITPERCARVRFGMTRPEVTALLGRPADQSAPGGTWDVIGWRLPRKGMVDERWHGRRWDIHVRYHLEGVVLRAYCWPVARPGPLTRLRSWLGW